MSTNDHREHWLDLGADEMAINAPRGWARDFAGVAEAMFSTEEGPPPAARINWLSFRVREFVQDVGGKAGFAFRLSLFAVTWLAPIWALSLPPFRGRSLAKRLKILERWEHSPFAMTLLAIKAFATMQYFEHPDVADEVGFDP